MCNNAQFMLLAPPEDQIQFPALENPGMSQVMTCRGLTSLLSVLKHFKLASILAVTQKRGKEKQLLNKIYKEESLISPQTMGMGYMYVLPLPLHEHKLFKQPVRSRRVSWLSKGKIRTHSRLSISLIPATSVRAVK